MDENRKLNRLIKQAEEFKHCSDGFIESKLWEQRDNQTSMNDIKNAIAEMRGIEAEKYGKHLAH